MPLLYGMNDKGKTTLVWGPANCIRYHCFRGLISHSVMTLYMQWMIKVKPHSCGEQLIVSDLIVCGTSYHTRAVLSCDIRPHKQTRSDTNSCSTHSCGFLITLLIITEYNKVVMQISFQTNSRMCGNKPTNGLLMSSNHNSLTTQRSLLRFRIRAGQDLYRSKCLYY